MSSKFNDADIIETMLVNGIYQEDPPVFIERRKNKRHWQGYDRRRQRSEIDNQHKPIKEEV